VVWCELLVPEEIMLAMRAELGTPVAEALAAEAVSASY
jgi:hypothetical protein